MIDSKAGLEEAIRQVSENANPALAIAGIKEAAVKLKATGLIPDSWESWQTLEGELVCEATFAQSDSHDGTASKLHDAIHGAVLAGKDMHGDGKDHSAEAKAYGPVTYVRAVHDKHVIYSAGGKTMANKYTKDEEGDVHLQGTPKEVEPSYQSKKAGAAEESVSESYGLVAESGYDAATGELPVTIIKPGLSKNNRFYGGDMLKRDFKVFEGAKMFMDHATDKESAARPEGSVKDWVASLKGVHAESDGTLKGTAVIIDPVFKQKVQALKEAGLLGTLGVSIRAAARFSDEVMDGKKVKAIESFVAARSVDFVTFAGAGGRADAQ